jgi:hypothetical protein
MAETTFVRAGLGALAAITAFAAILAPAHAQNLVQNPDFANELNGYTVSGEGTPTFASYGDADSNLHNTVVFNEGISITQSIQTTPGVFYMISFLGASEPGSYITTFGDGSLTSAGDAACCTLTPSMFFGKASGTSTDLTFTAASGTEAITALDVEAAPAPVTGAGILSFCVAFAGLAFHRMRRMAR